MTTPTTTELRKLTAMADAVREIKRTMRPGTPAETVCNWLDRKAAELADHAMGVG